MRLRACVGVCVCVCVCGGGYFCGVFLCVVFVVCFCGICFLCVGGLCVCVCGGCLCACVGVLVWGVFLCGWGWAGPPSTNESSSSTSAGGGAYVQAAVSGARVTPASASSSAPSRAAGSSGDFADTSRSRGSARNDAVRPVHGTPPSVRLSAAASPGGPSTFSTTSASATPPDPGFVLPDAGVTLAMAVPRKRKRSAESSGTPPGALAATSVRFASPAAHGGAAKCSRKVSLPCDGARVSAQRAARQHVPQLPSAVRPISSLRWVTLHSSSRGEGRGVSD